jgi:hypothetical protein
MKMKLDALLSKLEKKAKVTLRCDWCRYYLVDTPPLNPGRKVEPIDPDRLLVSCPWCATEFGTSLKGLDDRQREAMRIFYRKAHGESYSDERVYAADAWFYAANVVRRWMTGELTEERVQARMSAGHQARYDVRSKAEDRQARERAELKKRADSFAERMVAREEELYGPHKHDLPARIEALEKLEPPTHRMAPGTSQRMDYDETLARQILYRASIMLICEPVLWGECLPETSAALSAAQAIIKQAEDERERERLEKERKKLEAEEARARERAARLEAAEGQGQEREGSKMAASNEFRRSGAESSSVVSDDEAIAGMRRVIDQYSPLSASGSPPIIRVPEGSSQGREVRHRPPRYRG